MTANSHDFVSPSFVFETELTQLCLFYISLPWVRVVAGQKNSPMT